MYIDTIASIYFTRRRDIMQGAGAGEGTGHKTPFLNKNEKYPFLFFSVFSIKAFLSSNMQRMQ